MSRHGAERPVIRVSAALIVDDRGRLLLVRKRGTSMLMQPGGKPEPGESAAEALARELEEELGIAPDPAGFEYLGRFDADAANERGHVVEAEMFLVRVDAPVTAAAEIEEFAWVHPDDMPGMPIAPLVLDHALGILRGRAASR